MALKGLETVRNQVYGTDPRTGYTGIESINTDVYPGVGIVIKQEVKKISESGNQYVDVTLEDIFYPRDKFTYFITVTNIIEKALYNVSITDAIPNVLEQPTKKDISANNNAEFYLSYDEEEKGDDYYRMVLTLLSRLEIGASVTFIINVTVKEVRTSPPNLKKAIIIEDN